MARGLASLLKLLNYEVWTAYDGPTGLEAARGYRPEVVLLDIGLPGLDGYPGRRAAPPGRVRQACSRRPLCNFWFEPFSRYSSI